MEGNATACGLYAKAYRCQNRPLVIDDVDRLYADKVAVRLLTCLAQTDSIKRVSWHSASQAIAAEGIPREFETRTRLILIANDWRTLNNNVVAVQDRGHMIDFRPTPEEVHARVAAWFADEEVYAWFGPHLAMIPRPLVQHDVRAKELTDAGLDWRAMIGGQVMSTKIQLVAELRYDPSYAAEAERVEAFKAHGGGSRATYFNQVRKLRAA